jgi:hypothetical protein
MSVVLPENVAANPSEADPLMAALGVAAAAGDVESVRRIVALLDDRAAEKRARERDERVVDLADARRERSK